MSYPIDLDEMPEERLLEELSRRKRLRDQGFCDYCERPPGKGGCKLPERHANEGKNVCRDWLGNRSCILRKGHSQHVPHTDGEIRW